MHEPLRMDPRSTLLLLAVHAIAVHAIPPDCLRSALLGHIAGRLAPPELEVDRLIPLISQRLGFPASV